MYQVPLLPFRDNALLNWISWIALPVDYKNYKRVKSTARSGTWVQTKKALFLILELNNVHARPAHHVQEEAP